LQEAWSTLGSHEGPGLVPFHTQADVEENGVFVVTAEDL
jgi:hypothetical protein